MLDEMSSEMVLGLAVVIALLGVILAVLYVRNGKKGSKVRPVRVEFSTPREVKKHLIDGNELFRDAKSSNVDISPERRKHTTDHGQFPYAVVITCSDSRVPPEHIFSAGLGELFVVRTAGHVIGDLELGSIEYAAAHLHSKLILVLGHENCGAISATLGGYAEGNIQSIINEISLGIGSTKSARDAEVLNVEHSIDRIHSSEVIQELLRENKVSIEGAIYRIADGSVRFLT